jgi:hypothetical protein
LATQFEIALALAGELIAQKAEGCFCHRKTLVARMIRPADLLPLWVIRAIFGKIGKLGYYLARNHIPRRSRSFHMLSITSLAQCRRSPLAAHELRTPIGFLSKTRSFALLCACAIDVNLPSNEVFRLNRS